jgi:hypothetical protein
MLVRGAVQGGIPSRVPDQIIREVEGHFADVAPLAGVGGSSKSEAKSNKDHLGNEDAGLDGHGGGVVQAAIRGLEVDLRHEDRFSWVTSAEGDEHMDES